MTLSVDKRYEIIFLSHHPMGPQLGVKAVAKAIKCAKSTVQYWLNRWKESKDLSDSKRIGRPRTTTKGVNTGGGVNSLLLKILFFMLKKMKKIALLRVF